MFKSRYVSTAVLAAGLLGCEHSSDDASDLPGFVDEVVSEFASPTSSTGGEDVELVDDFALPDEDLTGSDDEPFSEHQAERAACDPSEGRRCDER